MMHGVRSREIIVARRANRTGGLRVAAAAAVLLAGLAGCKSESAPEVRTLTKDSGDNQSGTVGQVLQVQPRVKVTGDGGKAITGATVTFEVTSGGGSVTPASATTNDNGFAAATWTLGQQAGASQELKVTLQGQTGTGSTVTFTASAGAGPVAALAKNAGDAQTGTVGMAVATPPRVKATDAFGNGVAGVTVTFSIASGGGTITTAAPVSNSDGLAAVAAWILGQAAGPNSLQASVGGSGITGNPATFTATANAGPPTNIAAVEGNNQNGIAGRAVTVKPKVQLKDQYGNATASVPVQFAVTAGGGSVTGGSQSTAADGTAAVGGWTLGSTGVNQLAATGTGNGITGNPVVFTANAAALFNATKWVGQWNGSWVNSTFGSTGTSALTIAVDSVAKTVTLTFSSTGNALGHPGGAPQQSKLTTYDDTGIQATASVQVYGDVTFAIDGDGKISMSGKNIGNGIECWEAEGTITQTQVILDFTVYFLDGSEASGRTTLNRQ